jgi:prepilin-type N-terminal cleavage/methylation domain-containing protein
MTRGRRGERGFTLMEVLVSLVVMVIGFMATLGLYSVITRSNATAQRMGRAKLLCEAEMEELRGKPMAEVLAEVGATQTVNEAGIDYTIDHSVTAGVGGEANLTLVEVVVSYPDSEGDAPRTTRMQMLRTMAEAL